MKLTVLPVVSEIAAGHSSKDVRAPSNVSGNFVWWKRRARGAFYTCWWVSILLFGVLINVISLAGFGQEALIVLAIMTWPLWVIVRNPPERPWDPGRLTNSLEPDLSLTCRDWVSGPRIRCCWRVFLCGLVAVAKHFGDERGRNFGDESAEGRVACPREGLARRASRYRQHGSRTGES